MRERRGRLRTSSGRSGFTMVEMMIVLVIIGVMVMVIGPALSEVLADNRAASAAMELTRLSRRARSAAVTTGTAYLLRFNASNDELGSFGLGLFELHMGMNGRCQQTPWGATFAADAFDEQLESRDGLNMVDYNPTNWIFAGGSGSSGTRPTAADTKRQVITLPANYLGADRTALLVCYEPNGASFAAVGSNAAAAAALVPQAEPITFTVTRRVNGVQHGAARPVIFPPGRVARPL